MSKKLNFKEDVIEIVNSEQADMSMYTLEINLTDMCNFKCTYCFEGDHNKIRYNFLEKNTDLLIKRIYELLENKWFKLIFKGLKIDFWGGEPTLNIPLMKIIIDEFKDNERVKFFIYTNGSRINKTLPILRELNTKKISHNDRKVKVQVSYDGLPVHDMCRVDRKNNPTSAKVRNSLDILNDNDILFNLKSTITPENIKYMPKVWNDFNNLYYRFGDEINYAPTLDYYKVIDNEKYFKELEISLIKIAKKEIQFYKDNGRFLFSWFARNKIDCGVGLGMSCVDIDGKVYYCHGGISLDNNNEHFCFSKIYDKNLINSIKDNYYKFKSKVVIDECQRCEATICLRCNIVKYINSQKEDFLDKFYDYTSQPILCKYYKLIGKIHRALALVIKGDI